MTIIVIKLQVQQLTTKTLHQLILQTVTNGDNSYMLIYMFLSGTVQRMTFSESLSSEEFKSYLKSEGVLPKDYDWLIGEYNRQRCNKNYYYFIQIMALMPGHFLN